VIGAERYQGEVSRALDSICQRALVLGANPGLAAGLHLPPVGYVTSEAFDIFVVYVLDMVDAEAADLPAAVVPGPPTPPEAASASGPASARASAARS
jgi:hypothetical protein